MDWKKKFTYVGRRCAPVSVLIWVLIGLLPGRAYAAPPDPFDPGSVKKTTEAEDRAEAGEDLPSGDERFQWLDPSKTIYVLQNRKFKKDGHGQISVGIGPGFSQAYRDTWHIDGRLTYWLSESFGLEGMFNYVLNNRNAIADALAQAAPSTMPRIRETRWDAALMLQWVPWYAKINVFNAILHFDWYFQIGGGYLVTQLDTNQVAANPSVWLDQNFFAGFWGTGLRFHASESVAVRLDLTGALYQAPLYGNSGANTFFAITNFALGLGLKL